ncbi:MAG: VWA domain-containing protein [Candidatus Hydrogenedentes bacterium]|nr:VWA domain-containing protein [Candidatus Hydrogenedentota bacterium]
MNIEQDDPRLTAYALGELDDSERNEFEQALADDDAAQAAVQEIQRAAEVSRAALQLGAAESLSEDQRQAILLSADKGARRGTEATKTRFWYVRVGWGVAAAAAILISITFFVSELNWDQRAQSALTETIDSINSVLPNTRAPESTSKADDEKSFDLAKVTALAIESALAPGGNGKKIDEIAATSTASPAASNAVTEAVKPPDEPMVDTETLGNLQETDGQAQKESSEVAVQPAPPTVSEHASIASPSSKAKAPADSASVLVDKTLSAKKNVSATGVATSATSGAPKATVAPKASAPSLQLAQRSVEEVELQLADRTTSQRKTDEDRARIMKDVESQKQLALGTDSSGIKPYKMQVEAPRNGVDLYQGYIETKNAGAETTHGNSGRNTGGGGGFGGESFGGGFGGGGSSVGNVWGISRREEWSYDVNGDGVNSQIPFYTYRSQGSGLESGQTSLRWSGSGSYPVTAESGFQSPLQAPLSTFSIDVDTASYTNVRRFLTQGHLPPREAVRIEELLNYFGYEYAGPTGADPIAVRVEVAPCPWAPEHRLARVALKARDVPMSDRAAGNFVFVIDVSGSMADANKLPLLKESMKLLVRKLNARDRVGIVTYRDSASIALASMPCEDKNTILAAIESLHADGSTNGEGGIQLGYTVANANLIPGGINRVLLATDGDFNVGVTENDALVQTLKDRAKSNIFLTVLGFGSGNIKDDRLEALADKGHGHYVYIDNFNEANRVLGEQTGATLVTVAKDVKVQVEFNPAKVNLYRLVGYDDRLLAPQDFNDDRKDAGEMGAGHAVTALYEIVPAGVAYSGPGLDPLKYAPQGPGQTLDDLTSQTRQLKEDPRAAAASGELMTIKIRYKDPNADASKRIDAPVTDPGQGYDQSSRDYRWAAAVAEYGMVLRDSQFKGTATIDSARAIAEGSNGFDPRGQRAEFINLLVTAKTLLQK